MTSSRTPPPTRSRTPSTPCGAAACTRAASPGPEATNRTSSASTNSLLAGAAEPTTVSPLPTATWAAATPTPPATPVTSSVDPVGRPSWRTAP